jgi:hypothetical protein
MVDVWLMWPRRCSPYLLKPIAEMPEKMAP